MNCIAMRVAIVSAIMNGFAMLCTSVPVYNILDFGSSAFGFERRFWLALPSISVSVCGKLTDAYSCPARLKKQALLRSLTAQGIKRE